MPEIESTEINEELRVSLGATGIINSRGKFEILAITAGSGNGWQFSEEVLRSSLELWDGVECFIDHGGWFGQRSVKDLGGVCRNARWSEDKSGIVLDLGAMGPSGPMVTELGREMLIRLSGSDEESMGKMEHLSLETQLSLSFWRAMV